ncbi:hypothetical protein P886_2318 [Alteromonadaceae bacterium 2753L.S.0a.02]|nr:hypothetical protein P886_2318 [Alteromonadaceae bacterium 2753L.S.0a.02]
MIKFNISKSLSDALSNHLQPEKSRTPNLIWNAELITVGTELCVVTLEHYSEYVMVFCGLERRDFLHFPSLFQERFWREVSVLCPEIKKQERNAFANHLLRMTDEQYYQMEPTPSNQHKILTVAEHLEYLSIVEGKPLPIDCQSAFEYGLRFNDDENDEFSEKISPVELFRDICKHFVEEFRYHERVKKGDSPLVLGRSENVIRVDFKKKPNPDFRFM